MCEQSIAEAVEQRNLLAEECGEVVQVLMKINRFSNNANSNEAGRLRKKADLEKEIGDVLAAVSLMAEKGEVDLTKILERASNKIQMFHDDATRLPKHRPEFLKHVRMVFAAAI